LKADLAPHLVILIICSGIIAAALIITPTKTESPYLKIGSIPLPDTCIFHNLTGLPCPGCGLSRSIVAAAHGEIINSFSHHRLGLLTLVYILLQFVFRLGWILFPKYELRFSRTGKYLDRGIIGLAVLFGLNWILTLSKIALSA
jgi:hypothetical protein